MKQIPGHREEFYAILIQKLKTMQFLIFSITVYKDFHQTVQIEVNCLENTDYYYCKTRINNVPLILTILTFAINSLKF